MRITPIQLAKRVERWQKVLSPLGIVHFTIAAVIVTDEMPSSGNPQASVQTSEDYDYARFWFRDDWLAETSALDLDRAIVHEWLHVAFRDLDHSLRAVERWMPEATFEDWEERVDHEREGVIDRLAHLIVDLNR